MEGFVNKKELIDSIAEKADLKKVEAERALKAFESTIIDTLKKGNKVTLVGFGTFTISSRKERKGRNPKTGAPMTIPAKKTPKFIVGKNFKESI